MQVSTVPDFITTVYSQTGITATSTGVTGLSGNTTYYWRVNATNTGGTSGWSGIYSFTTGVGSAPSAPILASPLSGSTNVSRSPTLSWNAAAGASTYTVQVSTNSNFTTFIYNTAGISSTSTTVSGLGSRVTYYWRVVAVNGVGSATSSTWNFNTRK